ncbi:serine/threonine protein kinase [Streptomyces sp. LX-29]|uniref:WD40 repeat domain-containing serine/threonine protein kinase n=1 Tax=Streptomyces sp. LX-29 TaxID=2900152 RepID=UPI00240E51BE|nr:serine/threonine-protein kinase [Streptomyces sp. LX-29]WFB05745.1 serine/threonine protein kinase [Streptomyces sp. LX-29]
MDALQPDDPRWIGPYRLEGRLGAGGMGQVFLGTSPGGRKVAVKVIRPELAATPQFRTRFAREIDAARRVGGFHTAQVVDADSEAESPWLVTAFVAGPTLQQVVASQGPLTTDAVMRLGAGLAEGLAAIHRCGLVHRDLKPGNVILADDGPRIIDFGIARAVDASSLTATGTVMGTYAYMSPEQIRADRAGPASDVFSLGSVLVFAATGHSPFDAPDLLEVVERILDEPPVLDGLDEDLRGPLAGCLAKDPAERPLVTELPARFAGLPSDGVAVRPAGPEPARPEPAEPEEVTLPAAAGPTTGVAGPERAGPAAAPERTLLLAPGPGQPPPAPPTMPYPPADVPGRAVPTAPAARTGRVSRRALIVGGLAAAAGTAVGVPLLLRAKGDGSDDPVVRSDTSPGGAADGVVLNGLSGARTLAFSPDAKTLFAAGDGGTVWRWDVTTRRGTSTHIGIPEYIQPVQFSPDRRLLVRAEKNKVLLWDVASGRMVRTFHGPPTGKAQEGFVHSLTLSPDGGTIVASLSEGLYVWDTASGRKRDVHKGRYSGPLAISPDGRLLVTAYPVRLRELPSCRVLATVDEYTSHQAAVFSPDGQILALGQLDGTVRLWNAATRQEVVTLKGHKGTVNALAFHPSGRTLAGAGRDGTVRLWDTASGKSTATFTCPNSLEAVAFSPDGKMLAAGLGSGTGFSSKDTVRLWTIP